MKKPLLSFCCLALIGASPAFALPVSLQFGRQSQSMPHVNHSQAVKNPFRGNKSGAMKVPTRAASELKMEWGYCGDPYNAFELPAGVTKGAIMVSKEIATQWAGAAISAVQIANPTNMTFQNPMAGESFAVWISESLDGDPICSGEGVFGPNGIQFVSADLDKEYILKANTPIYIGYTYNVPEKNNDMNSLFTLVTDMMEPETPYSAYLYSTYTGLDDNWDLTFGDTYKWTSVGNDLGNICLTATISGDMLPQDNVTIPDFYAPVVVKPDSDFDYVIAIQNRGANVVENFDLTMNIEGTEPQVKRIEPAFGALAYNEFSIDSVKFSCNRTGNNIPYTLSVSAINGKTIEDPFTLKGNLISIDKGFKRNVVIEEATGTWCGWCVVGYAGMEYMKEAYSGKGFIGIALHGDDPMDVLARGQAYAEVATPHISGFPSAFMDRNWGLSIYPSPEELDYAFSDMMENPAFATISATVEPISADGRKVRLSTSTMFAEAEDNADYGVAYTVVEDGVGPYIQSNYAAGAEDDYYGFEDMGAYVPLVYNDVARNCSHPAPIEGSLPSKTEANKEYAFSTEFELTDVKDLSKCRVVAMVVDRRNGMIQNACEVAPNYTGVESVAASGNSLKAVASDGMITIVSGHEADIYSADGKKVASAVEGSISLPTGIYLVNAAGQTVKVIVR